VNTLEDVFEQSQDEILKRITAYADRHSYNNYYSSDPAVWRTLIKKLSATLARTARGPGGASGPDPEEDEARDAMTLFGISAARVHRSSGLSLDRFFTLIKFVRQCYGDIVQEAPAPAGQKESWGHCLCRGFDRLEAGVCREWSQVSETEKIVELQSANLLLVLEKNKFLSIFDLLKEPALFLDKHRCIVNMNRAAQLLFHVPPVGAAPHTVPARELLPWLDEKLAAAAASGDREYCFEQDVPAEKGRRCFLVKTTVLPEREDSGDGFIVIFDDITDQKRTEEVSTQLISAVEQAAEAICILGSDGIVSYVNPAVERITGYTSGEVLGKNAFLTEKGVYDQKFYSDVWQTVQEGKVWTGNVIYKKKDGSLCEFEQTISPIRDAAGAIRSFVTIGRDVTNERRLERELRQAQKMEAIGTLAGGIAHDFNNILTAIIGYTELSLRTLPESAAECFNARQVLTSAKRARDLVRQILTFSRQAEKEMKPLNMSPVIKETLRFLRASIPTTVEIRQSIQPAQDIINSDPTQLQQILMNLCTNAAHAMKERGGVLEVKLEEHVIHETTALSHGMLPPGSYRRLTVQDSGHGMDRETLERMFDPYFTTKAKGEGTGLGLAVVHGIVKDHNGAIAVKSLTGQGTTFEVFFPKIESFPAPEAEKKASIPYGTERILFVDDEAVLVDMTGKMLETLGYNVVARTSSVEALEAFRANPDRFDLVISDKIMPNMTGFDLAAELIRIRSDIPIILCTGFSEKTDPEKAKRAGIRSIIMKPIIMKDIAAAIRSVLDAAT